MKKEEHKKKKEDLLKQVVHLFMSYGIKSMTMDDVARHLGKSKKTIYQFVDDKKDLVTQSVEYQIGQNQEKVCCAIEEKEGNAIDQLVNINLQVNEQLKNIHPSVLYDLKKYYPKAWMVLQNHKQVFIRDIVLRNLKLGIKDGLYREDLKPEIVTELYLAMVNMTLDPDFKTDETLSVEALHTELLRYHIRGIASKEGIEYLMKKLNNKKDS